MDSKEEIWMDVNEYEGMYQISNLWKVKSLRRIVKGGHIVKERILKPSINRDGYRQVVLSKDAKQTTFTIHRLVAMAFIPNPNNLPVVNHLDGNKLNNSIDNLEWDTVLGNSQHAHKTGLINQYSILSEEDVVKIVEMLESGKLQMDIAIMFNVSMCTINAINTGRTWSKVTGYSKDKKRYEFNRAKLTEKDVLEIVDLVDSGYTYKSIGNKFSVGISIVHAINTGVSWSEITGRTRSSNKKNGKRSRKVC